MPSAGSVVLRRNFADLITDRLPFIDEIIDANLDMPNLTYPLFMDIRDSKRAFEYVAETVGLGLFSEKGEAEKVSYDKMLQGFNKKFTHVTYGKAVEISEETADDDIDGAIVDVMPQLSFSAKTTIEVLAHTPINNGFGTTLTGDGVAWFSASHLLPGGGTFSNLIATTDMSHAALETALTMFSTMLNNRGLPINVPARKLIFSPTYQWLVREILNSDLRSDTANNAINALQNALDPVMSVYLSDAYSWYLSTDTNKQFARVYWRREPTSDHTIDFDTGNLKTKMTFRMSQGVISPYGWVGVSGAS